jgi:hypothetical protein
MRFYFGNQPSSASVPMHLPELAALVGRCAGSQLQLMADDMFDFNTRSVVVFGLVSPRRQFCLRRYLAMAWRFSTTLHRLSTIVDGSDSYGIALFQTLAKSQTHRTSGKTGNIAVVVG